MILDTTFVIDIMDNDKEAVNKLHELIKRGENQLITAPTVFELYSGMARSKKPANEKNKITKILNGQLIIHFDNDAAERGGEIDGNLIKDGKTIQPIDCMIAGIALVRKEKVLTRNIKDFSKIKDLEIETY